LSIRTAAAAALLAFLLPLPGIATAAAASTQASNLMGMTVVDGRNKRVGVVTDLAVDLDNGQIVGLQVGHATAEGMAQDVFPWSSVRMGSDKIVVSGSPIAGEAPENQSLAKILHAPLRDAEGKAAGEIDDLMVTLDTAKVDSFIIHFDPKWLDMKAPAAVPLSSLARNPDGFLVKFNASYVRPAGQSTPIAPAPPPPTPRVRLTQLADADAADVFAKAPANLATARRVLASRIVNPSGEAVGKVEDVVVDKTNGTVDFAVASFKPDWVASGWLVVVPVRSTGTDANGQPTITISLNQINNAFLFEAKNWPDFSNPAVRAAIHAKIDHM
jgi:sporulation protein YlmC with PRC-barrel domain